MPLRLIAFIIMFPLLGLATRSDGRRPTQSTTSESVEVLSQSDTRDERAYALLFRLVATMPGGATGPRARSYMRLMGLGHGCTTCPGQSPSSGQIHEGEPDLEAFATVLSEFGREIGELDIRAQTLQGVSGMSSDDRFREFIALRKHKDTLVNRYVAMLPGRLGSEAAARIDEFVQFRFKPRIKQYRVMR